MTINLNKINTSYWSLDDAEWVAQREAKWPAIELMVKGFKSKKKSLNPIKDYYLRGKMPNWKGLMYWDDTSRHLDLFMMLWLHPSWDKAVLSELRDAYMASDLVTLDDIKVGFGKFLYSQIQVAASPYRHMQQVRFPYVEGKGELLFDVMMGDRGITEYELASPTLLGKKQVYTMPREHLDAITTMGAWLTIENLLPVNEGFLFQYDGPLEWWYECCETNDDYFENDTHKKYKPYFEKALWRIHNFDTEKECDTCRTRFVHKIRKILDEREFIPEFKQMWLDVKAGRVEVKDPWKR